jgi:hypothetical protein
MDMSQTPCVHEPLSPAVQRCCDARNRVFYHSMQVVQPDLDLAPLNSTQLTGILKEAGILYETQQVAAAAYRYAMPDPSTRQGIKDYIACVLHGMTVAALSNYDGTTLLAGARIALAALRGRRPRRGVEKANTPGRTEIEPQPSMESAA